jgi:hypothetical protein
VSSDDGRSVVGASVFVDGRAVGQVDADGGVEQPLGLSGEVFVDAGSRRFSASLPDCKEGVTVLAVPKGGSVDVGLMLECKKKLSVPLIAAGIGVAAAGIGLGIGTAIHSTARSGAADAAWVELYDKDGQVACTLPVNAMRCGELSAADEDARLFKGVAITGFVVGGTAALLTTVYWLSGRSSPPPVDKGGVRAAFGVVPGGGGAVVWGSF